MAALLAAGCTGSLGPQPVPIDRAECARCRMLISSDATGGQIVAPHDDPRFYDDIGCLAADAARLAGDARAYVRTASGAWADARTAAYARPPGGRTPMGSGVIAFETAAAAQAAAPDTPILTWHDVVALETAEARK